MKNKMPLSWSPFIQAPLHVPAAALSLSLFLTFLMSCRPFANQKNQETKTIRTAKSNYASQKTDFLKKYPEQIEGKKRNYIQLPGQSDEYRYKVEIYVGKSERLDCNQYFLIGEKIEKTIENLGYNYFIIETEGRISGTRMTCPDNATTVRFIHLPPFIIDYNSRLPIVIYAPEFIQIRYKIYVSDSGIHKGHVD